MHTAFISWYQFPLAELQVLDRRVSLVLLTAASLWAAVPSHWWASEWKTPSQTQGKTLETIVMKDARIPGGLWSLPSVAEAPTRSGWMGFPTCGHLCFKSNCFKAVDSKWVASDFLFSTYPAIDAWVFVDQLLRGSAWQSMFLRPKWTASHVTNSCIIR